MHSNNNKTEVFVVSTEEIDPESYIFTEYGMITFLLEYYFEYLLKI